MYSFKEENTLEAVTECMLLAKAHYEEVEDKKSSIPFKFDINTYKALIDNDMLCTVIVRKDGNAVGYMANLVTKDLMTSKLSASEIGIYLSPEVRGGKTFLKLMKATQQALKDKGVVQHMIMFKAGHDVGMAQKLGYRHTETTYMKLLGE